MVRLLGTADPMTDIWDPIYRSSDRGEFAGRTGEVIGSAWAKTAVFAMAGPKSGRASSAFCAMTDIWDPIYR
jgi:hypothetical protein